MKTVITLFLLLLAGITVGQRIRPQYSAGIHGGIANGEVGGNGWVATTQGIQQNGWFLGAGAGIDFYRFRSIPVFVEGRREFGLRSIRPMIYCSAGVNIDWLSAGQKTRQVNWQPVLAAYDPGFFLRSGVAVVFNAGGRLRYTAGAGWSFKSIRERYQVLLWEPSPQPWNTMTEKSLVYKMNRLDIGFGLLF
ncbi:MAG TPA: hypothetical protein VF145_11715 [Chitinophagaceae bacterium]